MSTGLQHKMAHIAVINGTWTPTMIGQATAGTTTYTLQSGIYVKIGRLVYVVGHMNISGATGTGRVLLGGFPFAFTGLTSRPEGICVLNSTTWSWQVGRGNLKLFTRPTETNSDLVSMGSARTMAFQQMQNVAANFSLSMVYQTAS